MPLYEYKCNECGKVSEFLVGVSDADAGRECSSCGSTNLSKMISASAVPTHPLPKGGKTCCGRDERCDSPPCGSGCCPE